MDIITTMAIFCFCIAGSVYTSYRAGLREGAEQMVMILEDLQFIVVDDDGNITPPR